MYISVTEFRASCLEFIRRVEVSGEPVDIKRRGKVVARLTPPPTPGKGIPRAWEVLRGSGDLKMEPQESMLQEVDSDAGESPSWGIGIRSRPRDGAVRQAWPRTSSVLPTAVD